MTAESVLRADGEGGERSEDGVTEHQSERKTNLSLSSPSAAQTAGRLTSASIFYVGRLLKFRSDKERQGDDHSSLSGETSDSASRSLSKTQMLSE